MKKKTAIRFVVIVMGCLAIFFSIEVFTGGHDAFSLLHPGAIGTMKENLATLVEVLGNPFGSNSTVITPKSSRSVAANSAARTKTESEKKKLATSSPAFTTGFLPVQIVSSSISGSVPLASSEPPSPSQTATTSTSAPPSPIGGPSSGSGVGGASGGVSVGTPAVIATTAKLASSSTVSFGDPSEDVVLVCK